jgi:crotonobetainyl-CoA:carnitine CoA-transferase CaiB-like acyl-CoA transferase
MSAPPLDGLHVLELGSYVTGPYAASLLADLGAHVIKVERPPAGDPFRSWGGEGMSPTFASLNKGKASIGLSFEQAEGVEVVKRLAQRADVLIENFRPGTLDRVGLGYADVAQLKPSIVYCSISGFGSTGPYAGRPGYDTVGQAMSGLLGLLTDLDDPKPMGLSIADHVTGLFACYGILAAVVKRSLRGEGSHVETSLLQATTSFLAENVARHLAEGEVPSRATRARLAQAYAFRAGDGAPFVVHLSSPTKFWDGLTAAVDAVDLRDDERFRTRKDRIAHYDELHDVLSTRFATQPRAHWLDRLAAHDVPAGPINRLDEVFADEGIQHLDLVADAGGPSVGTMRLLRGAVEISGRTRGAYDPPPLLGEHTHEILRAAGFGDDAINDLEGRAVVYARGSATTASVQ